MTTLAQKMTGLARIITLADNMVEKPLSFADGEQYHIKVINKQSGDVLFEGLPECVETVGVAEWVDLTYGVDFFIEFTYTSSVKYSILSKDEHKTNFKFSYDCHDGVLDLVYNDTYHKAGKLVNQTKCFLDSVSQPFDYTFTHNY
jgi:hypothetical protein